MFEHNPLHFLQPALFAAVPGTNYPLDLQTLCRAMKIVWVKSMVHPLAWIIVLSGFMMQYETEAIRLYSSSLLGFVGHGVRINSFKPKHLIKSSIPLPRSDLGKASAFNPVKSIFDTLLSVPNLIFGRTKQETEDNATDDLLDFELDQEKQWRREERDELEHWHYWTSEQGRLREEDETKQVRNRTT